MIISEWLRRADRTSQFTQPDRRPARRFTPWADRLEDRISLSHTGGRSHIQLFQANLDSAQVPPPTSNSPATGVGLFTLNTANTARPQLGFTVTYQNLIGTVTGVHFHDSAPGARGPLEHEADITGATPVSGTLAGVWSSTDTTPLTPQLVKDIRAGNVYIDIHTTAFPMGEIRGQLVPLQDGGEHRGEGLSAPTALSAN